MNKGLKMKFSMIMILSGILWASSVNGSTQESESLAVIASETSAKEIKIGQQDRFEVSLTYEHLDPSSTYGSWKNVNLSYYQKYDKELTLVYQAGFLDRNEGSAALFALGAYKDWSPSFYTFSQITAGTDSEYLPKYRIDNDFYFKFGERKQWVGVIGLTYIDYHDVHTSVFASLGLSYYAPKYNISYRFFANRSNPGSVYSNTHLLSMGYGAEKAYWTYFNISYGNQAYQAIYDTGNVNFNEDALNLQLSHKYWLTKDMGIFGALGYFNLDNGYDKYLFQIGIFKEF